LHWRLCYHISRCEIKSHFQNFNIIEKLFAKNSGVCDIFHKEFWHLLLAVLAFERSTKKFSRFILLRWKFSIGCTNSFQKLIFLRILNNASRVLFKQINLDWNKKIIINVFGNLKLVSMNFNFFKYLATKKISFEAYQKFPKELKFYFDYCTCEILKMEY